MKSPFTGGKVLLEKEVRKFEYRKEQFLVDFHFYRCIDSGEEFTDMVLDELNITQVHSQYESKFGMLTPQSPPPTHPAAPSHPAN